MKTITDVTCAATAAGFVAPWTASTLLTSQGRGVSAGGNAAVLGKRRVNPTPHDSAMELLTV